jgi:hypothetical protein
MRDKGQGSRHEEQGKGSVFTLTIPLLDRRGAETDERSESDEAGWLIINLI